MNLIARFFDSLWRFLDSPPRRGRPAPAAPPQLAVHRSVIVFVHGCGLAGGVGHSALLIPCVRHEFERWDRAEQRLRRRLVRNFWVANCRMEMA
jgi:hypothetical protein